MPPAGLLPVGRSLLDRGREERAAGGAASLEASKVKVKFVLKRRAFLAEQYGCSAKDAPLFSSEARRGKAAPKARTLPLPLT